MAIVHSLPAMIFGGPWARRLLPNLVFDPAGLGDYVHLPQPENYAVVIYP